MRITGNPKEAGSSNNLFPCSLHNSTVEANLFYILNLINTNITFEPKLNKNNPPETEPLLKPL